MDRTCTLCNVTTRSGFHWESHLASDAHRKKALQTSYAKLLQAAEDLLEWFDMGKTIAPTWSEVTALRAAVKFAQEAAGVE